MQADCHSQEHQLRDLRRSQQGQVRHHDDEISVSVQEHERRHQRVSGCLTVYRYNDKFKKFVHGALLSIDLFKDKQFPQEVIESIIYDLDYINFSEGSLLFNEGDECNQILIILSGTVDILMKYGIADIYTDTVYSG